MRNDVAVTDYIDLFRKEKKPLEQISSQPHIRTLVVPRYIRQKRFQLAYAFTSTLVFSNTRKTLFAPGLQKNRGCVYKNMILNFIYTHKKTGCK